MANKRMFSKQIVDSDAFLDMPLSAQCLYFHLNMRADDDGFVGNPKRIQRLIAASEDDMKLLIAKSFVLLYPESGIIVVKHWRVHNTLSKSRYKETIYSAEKSQLLLKDNGSYSFNEGIPLNDERLKNMWRTNGEQVENSDIDIDKDIDKVKEKINKKEKQMMKSEYDFNAIEDQLGNKRKEE